MMRNSDNYDTAIMPYCCEYSDSEIDEPLPPPYESITCEYDNLVTDEQQPPQYGSIVIGECSNSVGNELVLSSSKVIPSNYSNSEIDEPQHKYITKDKAAAYNENNTELQKVENLTQVTKSDGPAKKSNFWKDTALPIVMDICFPPSFPREARSPLTLIILIAFTILFSYIYPGPGCTSAYRRRR